MAPAPAQLFQNLAFIMFFIHLLWCTALGTVFAQLFSLQISCLTGLSCICSSLYTQCWPSPPSISSCVQLCSGGKSTPLLSHYWVRSCYFLLSRLFLFISCGFCLLVCFSGLFRGGWVGGLFFSLCFYYCCWFWFGLVLVFCFFASMHHLSWTFQGFDFVKCWELSIPIGFCRT